jgi:hypothetical protein
MSTGAKGALRLAGILAAASIWVKQEGVILWSCVVAIVVLKALWKRNWKDPLWIIVPGAILLGSWKFFLYLVKSPPKNIFMPVTPANLWAHLGQTKILAHWMAIEMLKWRTWSLLWPMVGLALLWLSNDWLRGKYISLVAGVVLPLLLFTSIYIFTNLDLIVHLDGSLPRLMLSPAIVAILLIVVALPSDSPETNISR